MSNQYIYVEISIYIWSIKYICWKSWVYSFTFILLDMGAICPYILIAKTNANGCFIRLFHTYGLWHFLWNFYGEQNLKSINKPIASLFVKLTAINFYAHKVYQNTFSFQLFLYFKQTKRATCRAEEQNKIKERKFSLNNCFHQNVV